MATTSALWLLLLGLVAENLQLSALQPISGESTGSTIPPRDPHLDNLPAECENLCSICNATGKVQNGFCRCFSNNGGEVVCLQRHRDVRQADTNLRDVLQEQVAGDKELGDAMRGQRCLGVLSSTRGALQNILGQGLRNMSATDRLTEFRKRVEALRSLSRQRSKSPVDLKSPLGTSAATAPKTDLPVSPFLGQPLEESQGNAGDPKTDPPVSPLLGQPLGGLLGTTGTPKTDVPVSPLLGQPFGGLPENTGIPKTDLPVSSLLEQPLGEDVLGSVKDVIQSSVETASLNEPPKSEEVVNPDTVSSVNPAPIASTPTKNTRRSAKSILPPLEGLNLGSLIHKVPGIQSKDTQTKSGNTKLRSSLENEGRVLRSSNPLVVNPFVPNNYFLNPALSGPAASSPIASNPIGSSPLSTNPIISSPLTQNPIASSPLLSNPIGSSPIVGNPLISNPLAAIPLDAHSILAAIGQGHIVPNLSFGVPNKASTSNLPPDQSVQNPMSTGSNTDARANSSPQFNPIGLAQNIYGLANGDMKAVQGIVESAGGREELGALAQGIVAIPQTGRTTN